VATRPGQAERALLDLREHFELRVSIREIWRGARPAVVVLRNLLGGAYGPASARVESDGTTAAQDVLVIEPARVRELADIAMRLLEPRPGWSVLSVDKANLWATSRLWRRQVTESFGERRVPVEHVLVDRAAFQLADDQFDEVVLLTEGIFGDVLSDLAAGRSGSIAMCASGSIHPGDPVRGRCTGLFEPVHGSAPRHVGADRVNPVGAYLALAAVLEWFPATAPAADAVRRAVRSALLSGPFTYDLADAGAPVASCSAFSRRINELYGETS
jgi:isocitrate/isopropylmalate dehydrogenase